MNYKKADTAFSEYVRRRDADGEGMVRCPIYPDIRRPWKQMVCGHYIKRRNLNTRWYPDNAFAISHEANTMMETSSDILHRYGLWIQKKIGIDRWISLMAYQQSKNKLVQAEIDEIERQYKRLINDLRN